MTIDIERRLHPRFPIRWQVQVFIPDSTSDISFTAEAFDLSQSGVQISCNREQEQQLIAQTEHHPLCFLRICITNKSEPIEVQCQLVFNRRRAQDNFQLGLKILQFSGASEALLEQHLTALEQQYNNAHC